MGFEHVVAQNVGQAGGQGRGVRGRVHGQRAPVHAQHLDAGRAGRHACRVFFKKATQVGNTGCTPLGEEAVQITVVLQPQRGGRDIEKVDQVDPHSRRAADAIGRGLHEWLNRKHVS